MWWKASLVAGLALLAVGRAAAADKENPKADSYIKVEVKGKLQTGVVAIGGETTGVVVQAKDGTLELDIQDKDLRAKAEKLNGKPVVVTGTLTIKRGVEIRQRFIVSVTSLKAAEDK